MVPYHVLVADPPWKLGDPLPGKTRGAAKNYACLTVDELCAFQIPEMAENSFLFLWRLSSMPEEALRVVRAWGFVPKSEIVWEKLTPGGKDWFGMGRYVRAAHETVIVATRGRAKVRDRSIRSRFAAPAGRHSQKPEAFFDLVERLCAGPYVELFARRKRPGWTVFGNEAPNLDPMFRHRVTPKSA